MSRRYVVNKTLPKIDEIINLQIYFTTNWREGWELGLCIFLDISNANHRYLLALPNSVNCFLLLIGTRPISQENDKKSVGKDNLDKKTNWTLYYWYETSPWANTILVGFGTPSIFPTGYSRQHLSPLLGVLQDFSPVHSLYNCLSSNHSLPFLLF